MEGEDALWAQTTDGGLLHQLFGYYPTLHDARVRELTIAQGKVTLILDYHDRAESGDELKARVRLEWGGVRELDLPLGLEDLYRFELSRSGDDIVAHLEDAAYGAGRVVSETFEVVLMLLDPGPTDEPARLRYRSEPF